MKYLIITISMIIVFFSCRKLSTEEKMIKNTINKQLMLEMFDSVQIKNNKTSFKDFRQQHNYISIVYLKYGCNPCYTKFIKWNNTMDSIYTPNGYTVLFSITSGIM
jgi:hypothetical protein